ncbi:MAG: transcriptional regulator [Nitrosomonadales bacterium]|nr:transcriptional regulator [Nitrosomonadales bacterium]
MKNEEHILISLTPRHAENIFDGHKHVELRRRTMHISPGTTAWIYVKLPTGAITGRVTIAAIHTSSPAVLWCRFGTVSGLSKSEFFDYFSGVTEGVALELSDTKELRQPISLSSLREIKSSFQPPQFFVRLIASNPVLKIAMKKPLRNGASHR